MRILHVSEARSEGVLALLRHFVAEQVSAGHEVHVMAPEGMPVLPGAHGHRWCLQRGRPSTYRRSVAELRRLAGELQPDVVHLHSFLGGFFGRVPGALPRGDRPLPVVYQPHAWAFDLREEWVIGQAVRRWERFAARRTDVLVANCDDEVEEGRSAGVVLPAHVLGVAVDLDGYRPVTQDEQRRQREALGLTAKRVVVCVGRLVRQKGQDLLLAEWERQPLEDTVLVLVGPGDTSRLQALAPTQWGRTVLAVGAQGDVRPWMWAADLLLLPSRYETVGVVVAEALACGRPVVATEVNGVPESLVHGPLPAAGAVVGVGAMSDLLDRVCERLWDTALWEAESRAARVRAESLFGARGVAVRLENAYGAAISGNGVEAVVS